MYNTDWGKLSRESLDELITKVEQEKGQVFPKTESAELAVALDADKIMTSVVLTNNLIAVMRRVRRLNQ